MLPMLSRPHATSGIPTLHAVARAAGAVGDGAEAGGRIRAKGKAKTPSVFMTRITNYSQSA